MRPSSLLLAASLTALAALTVTGCSSCGGGSSSPAPGPSAASSSTPAASAAAAGKPPPPAPSRQGNVVGRAAEDDALYIADEDSSVLHIVPLPFDKEKPARSVALPGRPAQVLPLADRVLVTIRDPGLLLVMRRDAAAGLVEAARVSLPADAWGIAITKDEKTALVSSAWTHKVSGVDLGTAKVRFSVDVAREPRGIAVMGDGSRAYVSHLVGSALTRIDGIGTEQPSVKRVALPAGPLRVPYASKRGGEASLGYSLALSPDEKRLFAARHALGASGPRAWAGVPVVDVLLTRDDTPLAPPRNAPPVQGTSMLGGSFPSEDPTLGAEPAPMVQPRAMVVRPRARSVLVISEGLDALVELDALGMEPSAFPKRPAAKLGEGAPKEIGCGAPSGVALSSDEQAAYIFCRSTRTLAVATLDPPPEKADAARTGVALARLGEPPGDAGLVYGRKLFHDATNPVVSEGLGCAGCHPEGRDDGFTWSEGTDDDRRSRTFMADPLNIPGFPRQTPMLAGRVSAPGPYGWHAESPDLIHRVMGGFRLHRWDQREDADEKGLRPMATAIAEFVRRGLAPPPRASGELSAAEKRGKELFESAEVGCRACHVGPETTDRVAVPLTPMLFREGFAHEPEKEFKTPSLLHVGGTPPYYHDGSAATLEELIEQNRDRMGKTSQLSAEDRAALAAFLRSL